MRYYPTTTAGLREVITEKFPGATAEYRDVDTLQVPEDMGRYLLWMLDQVQTFNGRGLAAKRGRWIGYVQGRLESMGLLANWMSRTLTRQDVADKKE